LSAIEELAEARLPRTERVTELEQRGCDLDRARAGQAHDADAAAARWSRDGDDGVGFERHEVSLGAGGAFGSSWSVMGAVRGGARTRL
jgi:hypothetical protein